MISRPDVIGRLKPVRSHRPPCYSTLNTSFDEAKDPVQKTLYIGNITSREDADEVQRLAAGAGKVLHFKVMAHDDIIRRHNRFAIVELESEADAARVARALHGSFRGMALEVRAATAEEESAAGHPRIFGTMNMGDDPVPPTDL